MNKGFSSASDLTACADAGAPVDLSNCSGQMRTLSAFPGASNPLMTRAFRRDFTRCSGSNRQ
jgi:hypothetical protein